MHSLVWNGGLEGHQIQLVLYRAVCFLFQFFVREQWEEGRSFSLQALAFHGEEIEPPPIPLESSAFRFNALFGSECGIGGGGLHHDILLIVLRMVLSIPILSKGGVGRGPFLFAAGACFPAGRRSRPLVPGGSRFSFYSAGVDRISIHSFGFEFGSGRGLDFIELFMYR